MRATVECEDCGRTVAAAQLGNHRRALHGVREPLVPPAADGLVWEEPPDGRHSKTRSLMNEVRAVIVELKRHPKRWARIRDYPSKSSAFTQVKKLRDEFTDCEFKAGRVEPEGSAIWARFVGDT